MHPLFTICWMPILAKSHLEVMWVCQSVYSGPLSNPAVVSVGELAASFCQVNRVTDEALIAETAVWPNFFLMNIFFAFTGSKLFIIIRQVLLYISLPYFL